jgi:hypothetical protein
MISACDLAEVVQIAPAHLTLEETDRKLIRKQIGVRRQLERSAIAFDFANVPR